MTRAVHIITTGGTIASRIDPATGGAVPAVNAKELVELSPAIGGYASDVRVTDFGMLQSWNIGPEVMRRIAVAASDALHDDDVAGVVVTHGTDTMEETAFALDLLVDSDRPVVFTGAMRNASDAGFDGPRNLAAAVRIAVDPSSRGRGTLLAMNDEIHAARYVTKTHTTSFSTFASPETGPLGIVDDRGVWYRSAITSGPHVVCSRAEPNVHLVKMAAGADALILDALRNARVAGIVIEGSGAGNVPNVWNEPIAACIAASIPIVLVSRCLSGRIVPVYGGPGGGRTLHNLGVVDGGWLSGPKARVALSFGLGAGMSLDEIRGLFGRLCS